MFGSQNAQATESQLCCTTSSPKDARATWLSEMKSCVAKKRARSNPSSPRVGSQKGGCLSQISEKLPKPVLGRGLSALIPQARGPAPQGAGKQSLVLYLPIESIHRDGNQPRKVFKEERLRELAESMRTQGVIQPVLVRKDETGYRLIAGERRWRAAQLAGLREVPAILREASDAEAFELALVENLQRADLNPIEEAEGYRRLMTDYSFTQEQVSHRVAKDRSSVANSLRLLGLPQEVKAMLADGVLSMGHARALLGLT